MSRPHIDWRGRAHPDLVSLLGIEGEPVAVALQTDANGLRNPEGKSDPVVVVLGDSTLVAPLLPIEDVVSELLQARLGQEVLNVSESGYGPQEALLRLERTLDDVEGRLVLHFLFEGNDLADSKNWREWCDRPLATGWPETGLFSSALGLLRRSYSGRGEKRFGLLQPTGERIYFLYDGGEVDRSMGELPVIAGSLRAASARLEQRGARYAVVLVPMKLSVLHSFCRWPESSALSVAELWTSSFPGALRELCAEAGVPFLDATPSLVAAAAGGRAPYFARDTHLNAAGHEALAPWVEELLGQR